MQPPDVLCLTLDGDASGIAAQLVAQGWAVSHARSVQAAQRLQSNGDFLAALLVVGTDLPLPSEAVEALLEREGTEWIALCEAQALNVPAFRDLVLDAFFDHLLQPVDGAELSLRLHHASERAVLRRRRHREMHVNDALGMEGQGPVITRLRAEIRKVAATDAPVLIGGESGSGKELAARAIHQCSHRASGPFVVVNCGAIAPTLIHSELFGHERGAFTGASTERRGLIEAAHGGTLFLDEIGDLPMDLQTNLLRFLQEKTIARVGAVRNLKVDARVVAASHVDLAEAVAVGRFREDLFYRLNVLSLDVQPLRKRMEDVPVLAQYFYQRCAAACRTPARGFSRQSFEAMQSHDWPGNVRELYNRVQRAVVMTERRLISPSDLGLQAAQGAVGVALNVARTAAERDVICHTLHRMGRNVTHAARELGVSRMTLYRLMDKHSIVLDELQRGPANGTWGANLTPVRTQQGEADAFGAGR
ncbi:sigma-54 dependent transcriptional regulator [Variovorax dokdonensis]|uniref:Sigma-54 dependent transcriptional regulator n=1 Tax=Variovorax dokdonensis TaxID=344883 RepID=A0ABT7N8D8_9BURK|nr:sigma-54 dependent transcriptional regulator [Variovorax dokdonensis]MDM0044201.1 sigma-54 dependent transcriptional regulator [Variovorax dokdonensis]